MNAQLADRAERLRRRSHHPSCTEPRGLVVLEGVQDARREVGDTARLLRLSSQYG